MKSMPVMFIRMPDDMLPGQAVERAAGRHWRCATCPAMLALLENGHVCPCKRCLDLALPGIDFCYWLSRYVGQIVN